MWLSPRRCYKRGSEWGKNGHNVAKLPSKITKNRRRGGGNGASEEGLGDIGGVAK